MENNCANPECGHEYHEGRCRRTHNPRQPNSYLCCCTRFVAGETIDLGGSPSMMPDGVLFPEAQPPVGCGDGEHCPNCGEHLQRTLRYVLNTGFECSGCNIPIAVLPADVVEAVRATLLDSQQWFESNPGLSNEQPRVIADTLALLPKEAE